MDTSALERFAAAGVTFDALPGGRIRAHGELTAELRAAISEAKPAILGELAAIGEARRFCWLVTAPGREPFEVRCAPPATAAELRAQYPGSMCEPLPTDERGASPNNEARSGEADAQNAGPADDRRTCADCRNLDRAAGRDGFRRCAAARRGELRECNGRDYSPNVAHPRRCPHFRPLPADPING